jgi:hypothetical protein
MNTRKIEKLANMFSLAVIDPYDAKLRNTILNEPVVDGALPFKETAEMVIEHLNKIDPTGQNPSIKNTVHSLMDIVNNFNVPGAQQLMNASNSAYSLVNTNAPNDKDANTTAKYLSNLAKMIVYKYFREGNQSGGGGEVRQQSSEALWKFLARINQILRSGKALNQNDFQRWKSEKNVLTSRLNALNTTKNRTPQQEQERNIIAFIQSKLGKL